MTDKYHIKEEGVEVGTISILDDSRTFTMTTSSWAVKFTYRALNRKGSQMNTDWMVWKNFEFHTTVLKDYPAEAHIPPIGDKYAKSLRDLHGANIFSNCLIVKNLLQDTCYNFNREATRCTGTDYGNKCLEMMEGLKDKVSLANSKGVTAFNTIVIPYAYVKVCPRQEKGRWKDGLVTVLDLEFYSEHDRLVAKLVSGCCTDYTSVHGKYSVERVPSKEKTIKTAEYTIKTDIPIMEDCGCIDCKDSEYHIHDGVYLRCTLCGKEVLERDYDGEHYPEYCNRNIAKKIRSYQEKVATLN